jgi:hypothetical protein
MVNTYISNTYISNIDIEIFIQAYLVHAYGMNIIILV